MGISPTLSVLELLQNWDQTSILFMLMLSENFLLCAAKPDSIDMSSIKINQQVKKKDNVKDKDMILIRR